MMKQILQFQTPASESAATRHTCGGFEHIPQKLSRAEVFRFHTAAEATGGSYPGDYSMIREPRKAEPKKRAALVAVLLAALLLSTLD